MDWQFWQRHDLKFLALCAEIVVLKSDGRKHSAGVQAEISAARALGGKMDLADQGGEGEQ